VRDFYLLTASSAFLESSFRYENKVKDYNFGSLIRMDAREEYGETNTIFGKCKCDIVCQLK